MIFRRQSGRVPIHLQPGLQRALDQSQQLHAISEKRHQAELAKIESRSFIQRLKAVFMAN